MAKKVTLQDIAAACAVSPAAVSAAFHHPRQISSTLRDKILRTAQELGYFRVPELKNIGLVFENFRNHFLGEFYNEVIFGVLERAAELALRVQIFNSLKVDYQEICDLSGYLIIGNDSAVQIADVEQTRCPFVLVDCTKDRAANYRQIFYDCYQGIKELTEFICNCGHRRLAIINGETDQQNVYWKNFMKAVRDVFAQNNLPLKNIQIIQASYQNIESVEIALNKILSLKTKPTCVMCTNDLFAYYAYTVLKRYGLNIPQDISVTGFDGIDTPYYLEKPRPALTTVTNNRINLGRQALDFLLAILRNEKNLPKDLIFATHLRIGGSVRRLDRARRS
jgi:DNA-binding LacI/PurR family transcriptional regulator